MKFEMAIQQMEKGKKVRRASWDVKWFIYKDGDYIINYLGNEFPIGFENYHANDWEVVDDKTYYIGVDIAGGIETTVKSHLEGDKLIIDEIIQKTVDEDKNWNLADSETDSMDDVRSNIKKCRDLILEDLHKMFRSRNNAMANLCELINKRFGKLK